MSKAQGGDRFEAAGGTNLLGDMVYEKYDHTPSVSPEDAGAAEDRGVILSRGPAAGASDAAPGGEDWDPAGTEQTERTDRGIWAPAPKARFSDRVKVNQALRVITETFLGEKVQEQEVLSFFQIPLEVYLDFLHSRVQNAAGAVVLRMVRALRVREADLSRFEAAGDRLRQEGLWAETPRALWQKRVASLMEALAGALAEQRE